MDRFSRRYRHNFWIYCNGHDLCAWEYFRSTFESGCNDCLYIVRKIFIERITPLYHKPGRRRTYWQVVLRFLFPDNELLGTTLPAGSDSQSFILEFLLTFFLMLVIINVAQGSKEQGMFAGLAIGSVVLFEAMFAGPICGASMNPARSLAPAVVSGHLEHLWIYLTATIAGAAISHTSMEIFKIK